MNKTEQLAKLSEELLSDFEEGSISLEHIILKATKLARLVGDNDAHKWLRLELNGYHQDSLPADITYTEAWRLAERSSRRYTKRSENNETSTVMTITSVPALEATIQSSLLSLQNITLPTHVTPNQNVFQNENYSTVLANVRRTQNNIQESIKTNKNTLAKVRSGVYSFVFDVYSKYAFEVVMESIFSGIKEEVDETLRELVPDALSQFVSVFNRLRDGEGEDLSQAVSSCRNILDNFADAVYPPKKGEVKLSDGEVVKVGKDSYKNRLIAFIDENSTKNSDDLFNRSRAQELAGRLYHVHRVLSKGTKTRITKAQAERYVVETYLLIGELIAYIPKKEDPRSTISEVSST